MSELAAPNPSLADIETSVIDWYKSYAQPWYEGNVNVETSASYYAVPSYFAGPDGAILLPTDEAQESFFSEFLADLKSRGWVGTTLLNIEVQMINPCTAFIKTENTNHIADGSPIGDRVTLYSYLAGKTSEGWKFLSVHV
jgi:hypothetical protein